MKNPPRYQELFRGGIPTPSHLALQDDVYRDRLQNPATVRGYLRDLEVMQKWAMGINSPISTLREFDVAAFLRDQAGRGKSVPARLIHTLVWFAKAFGQLFH